MQNIKLSNGIEMPLLGYGVFQVPPQEAERCVGDALSVGYRLIDTAQAYFNEEGVGEAIAKRGIKREELFLVTKVWISNSGEEKAARSIDESLRNLNKGVMGVLPAIIASLEVNEAVKIVTGVGTPLKDTLFMIDLMTNETMKFKLKVV